MAETNNNRSRNRRSRKRKKRTSFDSNMRRRLFAMIVIFMVIFVILVVRIIQINVTDGPKYQEKVLTQNNYTSTIVPFKRGDILDSNGTILATSNKIYNLIIEPKNILDTEEKKEATIKAITTCFEGISREQVMKCLEDKDSLYKVVAKKLTYEQVQKFKEYQKSKDGKNVVGVWFEEGYQRVYPNNELACHVLGYVVGGDQGTGGLEGGYNSYLNGENGRSYAYLNDDLSFQTTTEPAINGNTLITTLDLKVQEIVQENAEEYMTRIGAKNISVLVMDPQTCEILALYNAHQYNPNEAYDLAAIQYQFPEDTPEEFEARMARYSNYDDEEASKEKLDALYKVWRNFVVSDSFEPGSTYKVFTIAGAIEDGILDGSETFYCDGYQQVADYVIHCHNRNGHGELSVSGALEKSCNDALMQVAAKEGPTVFDKYQQLFGFGQRTNIDISGEESEESLSYMIYHAYNLNATELATSSFGQGVTVTMMQLGTAFCSVINGGYYYEPHFVKQIIDEDGNVVKNYNSMLVRRTISEETSATMRDILFQVVEAGTGRKAGVEGYTIGGKTGTAEKLPRNSGNYILSFIGFAPVDKPQVVIYCVVDEPSVDDQAVSGAGSVLFNMIAEDLLPYKNIYKTNDNYDIDLSDAEDEIPTPIYEGNVPPNDVAGIVTEIPTESTEESEENEEEASEEGAN